MIKSPSEHRGYGLGRMYDRYRFPIVLGVDIGTYRGMKIEWTAGLEGPRVPAHYQSCTSLVLYDFKVNKLSGAVLSAVHRYLKQLSAR